MDELLGIESTSAYDREFSFSRIGMAQRRLVWRYLDPLLDTPGLEVLELSCGTGIDAVYMARRGQRVLATDISEEMLKVARETTLQNGMERRVTHEQLSFDDLRTTNWEGRFHLVLANMGGLNYMEPDELPGLGATIARTLAPKGRFIAVLMPDRCIAETIYYLLRGAWREAFRRGRHDPVWKSLSGSGVHTWYHHPAHVAAAFKPHFRVVNIRPIGFFVPPAYVENRFAPGSRMLNRLLRLDEKIGRWRWTARYADHFLIDLERLP